MMDHLTVPLGLKRSELHFADYDPAWHNLFMADAEQIRMALGGMLIDIEHFGSTAIPGIKAKPILDILAAIEDIQYGPSCIPLLESIGYAYCENARIPGDYTFAKGGDRVTHILHVVGFGSLNRRGNLKFRDILRANPDLAQEYEGLKQHLADTFVDKRTYTAGKTEFVWRVISSIDLDSN